MRLFTLAAALAALFPLPSVATQAADPAAAAPPATYRSVFEGTGAGVEEGTHDWRKANAEVARFPRGHADILKWEERQGDLSPPPAAPAPARAPAPSGHRH